MKNAARLMVVLLVAAGFFNSCGDKDNHIEFINSQLFDLMKEVYLWNDQLPDRIDPAAYSSPGVLMEALRYDEIDKWSTVLTAEEYDSYFGAGQMVGHGFMVGLDEEDNFRIAFLYRETQAEAMGVKRGWILSKVNGQTVTEDNFSALMGASRAGITNSMDFINENGVPVQLNLTKEVIDLTPVLHYEVLTRGSDKIGYMVFQDFIETANEELDEVFTSFGTAGINELIIDFRYNGGGSVSVAEHMAGWLIGKDNAGEPFIYYTHNPTFNAMYHMDTMYTVPANIDGLSLDRIFFIGTDNTASASELIIKGMEPYIESVLLAGSTTHGKPVGMYGIPLPLNDNDYEYVTLPVAFEYTNGVHEGGFYNGIEPQIAAADDITRDFGDPKEASLNAVLNYIESNAVSMKSVGPEKALTYIKPSASLGQYLRAF